ncbi:MAG: nucleotide exchange factor GrpE [Thermoleophilaceae bacterium]
MSERERPLPHEADPAEPAGSGDPAAEAEHDTAARRPGGLEGHTPEPEPGAKAAREASGPLAEPDAEEDEDEADPLARAQRERDEYLDLARRAQADFENYRKRAAREAAAAGERAKAGLVRELLPVLDNLERALGSAQPGEEHLSDGVRLVHSELVGVLARAGVEGFDPAGQPFDPERHEALSTRPAQDGAGSGVVLDVVERGYTLNGAVLRPARVVVSG